MVATPVRFVVRDSGRRSLVAYDHLMVRAMGETAASPTSLTLRGQRTRAALVQAARTVFEQRGYHDTRVVDITKVAGVAYGTFYTYFDSKELIFAEVVDGLYRDFRAEASADPEATPSDLAARIERTNRGYLRAYRKNARMMAVLDQVDTFNPVLRDLRLNLRRHWEDRSAHMIQRWQDEGLVDTAIDASYAATALGSMVSRSAFVWLVLGEPYDEDRAVEQVTLLYCRALGLPYELPLGGRTPSS
jgi:AcrR family transcriptional regulator